MAGPPRMKPTNELASRIYQSMKKFRQCPSRCLPFPAMTEKKNFQIGIKCRWIVSRKETEPQSRPKSRPKLWSWQTASMFRVLVLHTMAAYQGQPKEVLNTLLVLINVLANSVVYYIKINQSVEISIAPFKNSTQVFPIQALQVVKDSLQQRIEQSYSCSSVRPTVFHWKIWQIPQNPHDI